MSTGSANPPLSRHLARLAAFAGLGALAACAAAAPPVAAVAPATSPPAQRTAGLRTIPPCPDDVAATLTSGLTVHFDGAAADDPDVCIQSWESRTHRYYLGFWGNGRFREGTPEQRQAIIDALKAPVGTSIQFDLHRKTRLALWKSATVQHVENEPLLVGDKPRPTVKLRVVLHDSLGRDAVNAESLYWIDRATGVPLRKEIVTRMADGETWHTTIWQVRALQDEG